MREPEGKPLCIGCAFFYVTWDASYSRGCRAMGFKSNSFPSWQVKLASGKECQLFQPKKAEREQRN
jgi:hypothetical protein